MEVSEGEAGWEGEAEDKAEEQPSEVQHECVGMPRGFRDVPDALPAESKNNFVIFEDPEEERESEAAGDDLDGSFSFAPLESILEASHEVDEYAEAAPRTAPKTKPSFSVFQG